MFDTMTNTKILGGVCGTFLVFLLLNWAGESLFHVGASGHGGEEMAQAYVIETGESEEAEEEVEVPFAEVLASADAEAGAKVFRKCQACHKLDGSNGTGPYINGVVGRDIAAVDGFSYSNVLLEMDGDWSPEKLSGFVENPKGFAPGTKMSFAGLKKVEDRANLIAYLSEQQ
ncbi:c-type cytochrome [Aliiroseovarius sp. PTFE2010]|uniref:c-type cytochrome n=1 Tax=Aliiroseovarius sp. PTFE2010 TaxID=3417190 RepID=UPI003CF77C6C